MTESKPDENLGAEIQAALQDGMFHEKPKWAPAYTVATRERIGTSLVRQVIIDGEVHEFTASAEMQRQQALLDQKYPGKRMEEE